MPLSTPTPTPTPTPTATAPSDHGEEDINNNNDIINDENEEEPLLMALKNSLTKIDSNLREISENESVMFSTILQRQGCESRLIDYGVQGYNNNDNG
eukprot:309256_1